MIFSRVCRNLLTSIGGADTMQNNDNNLIYGAVAGVLLLGYFVARNKALKEAAKKGAAVTPNVGCTSSMEQQGIEAVANNLLDICKNTWIWDADTYQKVYKVLLDIPDRCAALGVYKSFGVYTPSLSVFYGSGDLDYWLGDCPEVWKKKFRSCLHGVGSF